MVKTKEGIWFKFDEVKGVALRTRKEIIERVRRKNATVEDDAPIAVFISGDKNKVAYSVDVNGWLVFLDFGCYIPADYDETCEAVAKALEA